jgi:2-phospho-L-lactate guanylyltransferase
VPSRPRDPATAPTTAETRTWDDRGVWSVVVPVKSLAEAKSRLGPLPAGGRPRLALAFALDAVTAVRRSPAVGGVFVVTADDEAARHLGALGAVIVPDDRAGGLNGAFAAGTRAALAQAPAWRVAALTADLPCLRARDLTAVLEGAGPGRAFVPDAPGTGTTLLLADAAGSLDPRFGPDSRREHEKSGAALVEPVGVSLRRDVDTREDLDDAIRLGVGAHTRAALAAGAYNEAHYADPMQGTVRIFDAATRGGTVLLDDGTELAYDGAAFDAGGLRFARPGQRVALKVDGAGRITALTLATFPLP